MASRMEKYYNQDVKYNRTARNSNLYKEVYEIVPYERLIKVDLPILFVHGLIDNMVPYELSVKVSKMCKNARLELIENGTHTSYNSNGSVAYIKGGTANTAANKNEIMLFF